MDKLEKHKIFFPELDGLRFFSFLIVFCSHIFPTDYPAIKNETWYGFFKVRLFSDGDIGVSFFFRVERIPDLVSFIEGKGNHG